MTIEESGRKDYPWFVKPPRLWSYQEIIKVDDWCEKTYQYPESVVCMRGWLFKTFEDATAFALTWS